MYFSHRFCFGAHMQTFIHFTNKIFKTTEKSKEADIGFLRMKLFFQHITPENPGKANTQLSHAQHQQFLNGTTVTSWQPGCIKNDLFSYHQPKIPQICRQRKAEADFSLAGISGLCPVGCFTCTYRCWPGHRCCSGHTGHVPPHLSPHQTEAPSPSHRGLWGARPSQTDTKA